MSGQAGRYQRSAGGMAGALIVLILVVGGYVLLRDLLTIDPPSPVTEVDYSRVADVAREQAPFPLVAPPTLPAGWRATNVNYEDAPGARWHVGFLTDEDRYVGLEQSRSTAVDMVRTHVDEDAVEGDEIRVNGQAWATWTDEGGDFALVRETDDVTTLVVGHVVPVEDLVDFTSSLE